MYPQGWVVCSITVKSQQHSKWGKSESVNIRFAQEPFYCPAEQHLINDALKALFTYGIRETLEKGMTHHTRRLNMYEQH